MMRYFCAAAVVLLSSLAFTSPGNAQISVSRTLSASPDRRSTLEELLVNRLRATSNEQKAYIKFLVKKVRAGKLDVKLVLAIQHKAVGKNQFMPFPYFERAMRHEAAKRKVILPPVKQFATTKIAR